MPSSTNLGLPYIDANQNQKHVTHNTALQILDALVQIQVQSAALAAPPSSPSDGQAWIVGAGATGAWLGKDLQIAAWQSGAWAFYPPRAGYIAYNVAAATSLVWTGSAWGAFGGGGGGGGAVTSVAGRTGAVTLGIADVSGAAPLASPTFTGTPAAPTPTTTDNSTKLATTAWVTASFLTSASAAASYAPLASPAFTGSPTAPTPATADNSTKLATTAWVTAQGYGTGGGGGAVTSVAGRTGAVTLGVADVSGAAPLASPAFTGTPTAPTQASGDSSTNLATTAFVSASFLATSVAATTYAPLASPVLTGTPLAPTPAAGDSSGKIATTGFVTASFVSYTYAAANYATAANATLTGTPTAPTQAQNDNSTRIATTAYADRAAAALIARTQVSNAAYTILASDRIVAMVTLTAARVLTLPAASAFPAGTVLTIVDESGACSATNTITVAAAGTDAINGVASAVLSLPYAYLSLESNTSNKWTVIDQPSGAVSSLNGGPLAGFRNRILNGNFAINQRAVSGTVTLAAGIYGQDRWKAGASGCTYTFGASGIDTTATITAGTLLQVIEALNVEGGTYTLSWTGTAQARVYQGTASGAYAASPITIAALPANANTTVEFSTGSLTRVQFEPGRLSTPFERRPSTIEIAWCSRYYQRIPDAGLRGIAGSTTSVFRMGAALPYPMRATPTVTLTGALPLFNGSSTSTATSISTNYSSATFMEFDFATPTSSFSTGQLILTYVGGTPNYYLQFNAEL